VNIIVIARCRVVGLAKAPKYNNRFVTVLEEIQDDGRYPVMFGSLKKAKLKPENLEIL